MGTESKNRMHNQKEAYSAHHENESRRSAMPVAKRAKQFMPFSAVQGLQEALHRKEAEIEDYDAIEHISEQEMIEEC